MVFVDSGHVGPLQWDAEVARTCGRMSKLPQSPRLQDLLLWPTLNQGVWRHPGQGVWQHLAQRR